MATTPTNKPIPSEDPRDLKFNAGKIDEVVTSNAHYYTDRFGVRRFTIAGFQYTAEEAIRNYGYITMDSFEDGATLTLPNQVLRYEATGEYYRWDGEFPKTVSAGSTPEASGGVGIGAWVSVGDASLRSDLALSTGAGLVGTTSGRTVQAEFDHFKIGYMTPDDFGAVGDGATDDTTPLRQAIDYCSSNGIALRIPAKSYVWNGGIITSPITIIGDRRPDYNFSSNSMSNGSVIIGNLRFSASQVIIKSLGVRRPTGSPGDCLVLSTNNYAGGSCIVQDVVAAGLSGSDKYNSVLVEGYDSAHVSQITGGYNLFGLAIKSRNVVARGVITVSCDTGVIIKSDSEFSTAKNVVLDGHINVGNGVSSQGVWIHSTTAQLERITCANLQSIDSAIHMRINSENVAKDVQIVGANYSGSTYADVIVEGASANTLYNVSLNSITAVNSQRFLAAGFCEHLMVTGFYGSLKLGVPADSAFEVSAAVGLFSGSNIQLVRQYSSDLMTINLGNSYLNNRLSSVKAKVIGDGKPRPGYKEQKLSGAAATMIVGDSLGPSGVVSVTAISDGSSFSSIAMNDDYGQPVKPGFLLIIRNASRTPFVMNHNPGPGGVANNGEVGKTIAGGDTIMYFFDGANWRQTPSIA